MSSTQSPSRGVEKSSAFSKMARQWAVSDVVARVKVAQPSVSKHLGVLREVGIVTVVKNGQQRLYRLHAEQLKPVHDWVKTYERYWTHQLGRIKERAERKNRRQDGRNH